MSRSLAIHTRHDKDKVHSSAQGTRHDQVHPSDQELSNRSGRPPSHRAPNRGISLPNDPVESHDRDGNTYTWSDGVTFVGEFYTGLESGKGKFTWPSGATYEGNFLNGCLHGVGTYTAIDGSRYSGSWIMNLKHGVGEKHYANGDHYKGNWYQGKREGQGAYTWSNGNTYNGGWKSDAMSGKGMLTWSNGDSFNGYWTNGKEHGKGVYTWVDSGCYVGTWSRGLKDGKGTYYPPGTEPSYLMVPSIEHLDSNEMPRNRRGSFGLWRTSSTDIPKALSGHTMQRQGQLNNSNNINSNNHNHRAMGVSSSSTFLRKAESLPTKAFSLERKKSLEGVISLLGLESFIGGKTISEDDNEINFEKSIVLPIVEREYAQGVLINEIVKGPLMSRHKRNRLRQQLKEAKRPGETILKGHRSYDLMLDLQLGIRYSVGKLDHVKKELEPSDFGKRARIWMNFPREGSHQTPSHHSVDFKWKDYCPLVFRTLREMFKIDAADYMLTICGNDALRELSSPGKSGSIFFLSHDDRFLIKTLRKQELKILLKMLPHYYAHVCNYENTLVTKFFGVHRVKLAGGHKVRFVVMGNVFCTELRIHRRFDLKGSSLGRSSDKIEIDETTTLKDLDLDLIFHLEPSWRDALLRQIEDDCNFLISQQIMDYSLLLGLHFRAPNYQNLNANKNAKEGGTTPTIVGTYPESLVLVAHEPNDKTQGSHIRGSSLRAAIAGDEKVDLLAGTTRLQIQLGANMPARAERKPKDLADKEAESFTESYDVVLSFGIIDILQEYNVAKKLEHAYKALQFDSVSISAVDPQLYSQRFQEFLKKVFPENLV